MNPIRKRDQRLGTVLGKLIESNPMINEQLTQLRVAEAFRAHLGTVINTYTTKILYKKGTLTLVVVSAPLRNELAQNTKKIIDLLNDVLGSNIVNKVILK